jgi:hypothetical protein
VSKREPRSWAQRFGMQTRGRSAHDAVGSAREGVKRASLRSERAQQRVGVAGCNALGARGRLAANQNLPVQRSATSARYGPRIPKPDAPPQSAPRSSPAHPLRLCRLHVLAPARLRRRRRPAHAQLRGLAAFGCGGCSRGGHRAACPRGHSVAGAAVGERVGQLRGCALAVSVAVRDGQRTALPRAVPARAAGRLLARRRRRAGQRRRGCRPRDGRAHRHSQVPRRLVRR